MNTNRLENLLGALAVCITDQINRDGLASMPEGLSAPAAAVTFIGHSPGVTISELSTALGLSHPGAVRLVDRLTVDRLVERRPSEEDRRAVTLWLTETGRELCKRILCQRASAIAHLLEALEPAELRALEDLAAKLLRRAYTGPDHALRICRLCDDEACLRCPIESEYNLQSTDGLG